jgi:hypothetical protein
MHFPQIASRSQPIWILLVVVAAFSLTAMQVSAFANQYVTSYNQSNVFNQSTNQVDTTYGPSGGSIWADNFVNLSNPQYIQAENWNITWSSTTTANIHNTWSQLGPVFHVFSNSTGNCASHFDYDGVSESNMSGYRVASKNADCWPWGNGHYNEARMYWNSSQICAGCSYYGGTEFTLTDGSLYIQDTNHVSNDIYFNDGAQKDNVRNGTWCFDGTNGHLWGC